MSEDDDSERSEEEKSRKFQKVQAERLLNSSPVHKTRFIRPLIIKTGGDNIEFLLRTTGIVSFVADCVAIYLFIQQLFAGQSLLLPSDKMIGLAVVIILAFVLSLSLLQFSGENMGPILSIFGMVYAVYGAILLSIISSYSIDSQINEIDLLGGYFVLAIVITAFCYVVMQRAEINMKWAAIPYILSSIFHIGFVLFTVTNTGGIPFLSHVSLVLGIVFVSIFLGIGRS